MGGYGKRKYRLMSRLKLKGSHQKTFDRAKKGSKKSLKTTNLTDDQNDLAAQLKALPKKGEKMEGTGRIVTAEDTVHGFETVFIEELEVGDVIIVLMQSSAVKEERVVELISSNRTCKISAPFPSNLTSQTPFIIRKDTEALKKELNLRLKCLEWMMIILSQR